MGSTAGPSRTPYETPAGPAQDACSTLACPDIYLDTRVCVPVCVCVCGRVYVPKMLQGRKVVGRDCVMGGGSGAIRTLGT